MLNSRFRIRFPRRTSRWTIILLSVVCVPTVARGQLPDVGSQLPIVSAVDEQGESFSTATLRGSYTVLVFGCLT